MGSSRFCAQLQAAKDSVKSPERPGRTGLHAIAEEQEDEDEARVEELRKKELESQKARIVAQMAVPDPGSAPGSVIGGDDQEQENMPPARTRDAGRTIKERERQREKKHEATWLGRNASADRVAAACGTAAPPNSFDVAAQTLTEAFEAQAAGKLSRDSRDDVYLPDPKVFIASWVDYCNKYGMGYALTDGSVGVYFNDSTSIVLSADKQ